MEKEVRDFNSRDNLLLRAREFMAEIKIWDNDTRVGKVFFNENPQHLPYARTVAGFNLRIPAELSLKSATDNEPRLCLNNLRLTFSLKSSSGNELELGRLHHDTSYIARLSQSPSESSFNLNPIWSATLPALLAVESFREDKPPTIHVQLDAELCHVITVEHWEDWQGELGKEPKRFRVMTVPQHISEVVDITYPADVWNHLVQKVLAESQNDPYLMILPLMPFLAGRRQ